MESNRKILIDETICIIPDKLKPIGSFRVDKIVNAWNEKQEINLYP